MMTPAQELKKLRGEARQEDFGREFGASQAQVSRLENGGCPTMEQALAIQKLHGIRVDRWPWSERVVDFAKQFKRRAG